jgi:hypothetical protein
MAKGKSSGIALTNKDAAKALGMVARGDREHDIACYFGVNQARITEVKDGSHGSLPLVSPDELPPKGPSGIKGRRLRASVGKATELLEGSDDERARAALAVLQDAIARYDGDEA